jgi:hypothetical protein
MSLRPLPSLHCARCGLKVTIQARFMRIENCPRCLARSLTISPLTFREAGAQPEIEAAPDPAIG